MIAHIIPMDPDGEVFGANSNGENEGLEIGLDRKSFIMVCIRETLRFLIRKVRQSGYISFNYGPQRSRCFHKGSASATSSILRRS